MKEKEGRCFKKVNDGVMFFFVNCLNRKAQENGLRAQKRKGGEREKDASDLKTLKMLIVFSFWKTPELKDSWK
jgi:hypothetical protein